MAARSSGRLAIRVFPNSQLGGDPEMLSHRTVGGTVDDAIDTGALSGLPSVGFAFQSYGEVWAAMDGGVGDLVREAIGKAGVVPMKRMWTTAFAKITSSSSRQLNSVEARSPKPAAPQLTDGEGRAKRSRVCGRVFPQAPRPGGSVKIACLAPLGALR
jgi:hypothetical protein